LFRITIGTVTAAGAATRAALEVIGRGKDQVWAFEVEVFRLERLLLRDGWGLWIHEAILSRTDGLCGGFLKAMGKIEA